MRSGGAPGRERELHLLERRRLEPCAAPDRRAEDLHERVRLDRDRVEGARRERRMDPRDARPHAPEIVEQDRGLHIHPAASRLAERARHALRVQPVVVAHEPSCRSLAAVREAFNGEEIPVGSGGRRGPAPAHRGLSPSPPTPGAH